MVPHYGGLDGSRPPYVLTCIESIYLSDAHPASLGNNESIVIISVSLDNNSKRVVSFPPLLFTGISKELRFTDAEGYELRFVPPGGHTYPVINVGDNIVLRPGAKRKVDIAISTGAGTLEYVNKRLIQREIPKAGSYVRCGPLLYPAFSAGHEDIFSFRAAGRVLLR